MTRADDVRKSLLLALLAVPVAVAAQDAAMPPPLQDPWIPPSIRKALPAAAATPPTQGAALAAQVERKLRASFEAAVVDASGTLTQEEARAAGLGYVADRFRDIDVRRTGRVSFDDLLRYLRKQGAAL
jgi:hypothetical protein